MKQNLKQPEGKKGGGSSKERPQRPLAESGLKITQDAKPSLGMLLEIMNDLDANSGTRRMAFDRVVYLANDSRFREHVVSELTDALECGDENAAAILGDLKAKEAVEELRKAAGDIRSIRLRSRRNAIVALGKMGEEAAAALKELNVALHDIYTERYAAEALAKIGPKAVPVLLNALRWSTNNHRTRMLAAEALGSMGMYAESALPELEKRTKWWHNLDGDVRRAVRDAIGKIREDIDADGKKLPLSLDSRRPQH